MAENSGLRWSRSWSYHGWLVFSLGGLVAVSWLALWWLEQSPEGSFLHVHGGDHHHGQRFSLNQAVLFVGGWLLMTIAMMLPSTFPLVEIFRRLVRQRGDAPLLVTLLVAGYLAIWGLFGAFIYWVQLLTGSLNLPLPPWVAPAGLFALAGAFQFSTLKYRCLDRCRAPLTFVLARWQGRRDYLAALRIGIDHGAFCVGCCWALMLLMFAVSAASLLWMAVLGLLMAVEKNVSWGRRLGHPLGILFLLVAVGILVYQSGVAPPAF